MNILVIVIYQNGVRYTTEIPTPTSAPAWRSRLKTIGNDVLPRQSRNGEVAGLVVIDGTEVYNYNSNEAAEVLGL